MDYDRLISDVAEIAEIAEFAAEVTEDAGLAEKLRLAAATARLEPMIRATHLLDLAEFAAVAGLEPFARALQSIAFALREVRRLLVEEHELRARAFAEMQGRADLN